MKLIKRGKPYRKHKCRKCKSIFLYKINYTGISKLVYCPECGNYLDFHWYDKKISKKQYDEIQEIESGKND